MKTESSDEIFYHYTSLDAFRNILESQKIWATESRYLNDATEFEYGFNLARGVIEELGAEAIEEATGFLERREDLYTYVFSLSRARDLLSQWRAYCPDGGVSIGFSRVALKILAMQQNQYNFELVECVYSKDEQEERVRKLVRKRNGYKKIKDFDSEFAKTLATFKHPKFEEEQEYRIIGQLRYGEQVRTENHPQWRTTKTLLIPYVEFSLLENMSELEKKNPNLHEKVRREIESNKEAFANQYEYRLEPFREVVVAPSTHQNLVKRAVSDFIFYKTSYGKSGRNPHGIEVGNSPIPYRAK